MILHSVLMNIMRMVNGDHYDDDDGIVNRPQTTM